MGKILRVNLTLTKIWIEDTDIGLLKKYIGGYGTAGRILYDEVPPWVGALDPANKLIFTAGPVTGTIAPATGRHTVVSKSPLTGYFGDANSGGFWGAEMKFSGFDMIIVTGRAKKPVYLWVNEGRAELKDATAYWGMNAREADRAIRKDLGEPNARVSTIGQAGENLVRIAGIMNDEAERSAARCGLGAVMGFMNLKAVAVRGHQKVPVVNPDKLKEITSKVVENVKTNPHVQAFTKGGTPLHFEPLFAVGDTPAYNWSRADFGGAGDPYVKKIAYPGGYEEIYDGHRACYLCPVSCRRVVTVKNDKYSTEPKVEGPEYETVVYLGSDVGVNDPKVIGKANDLCNLYGLDTISTGSTIAFAMECYERGIITKQELDGIDLRFGNGDALIEMIHKIANREGFGNVLAEGSRRAAKLIGKGSEYYAIHVKGVEIAAHDPRGFQGGGPHYACTPTGGRHSEGMTMPWEVLGMPRDQLGLPKAEGRFSTKGKGVAAKVEEDWMAFIASAGFCWFADVMGAYGNLEYFIDVYNAVTGMSIDIKEALKVGERIFTIKKAFNVKHGATRAEDTLPKRLLTEKGKVGSVVELDKTLPEYYEARGWDPATSKPRPEKLKELELEDLCKELWGA